MKYYSEKLSGKRLRECYEIAPPPRPAIPRGRDRVRVQPHRAGRQGARARLRFGRANLLREALRVTRQGGKALFSSYSHGFWNHRLEWFELQSQRGLLGEIDPTATRDGVIVCRDGFRAETMSPADFETLCAEIGAPPEIVEVDGSSVFCLLTVG